MMSGKCQIMFHKRQQEKCLFPTEKGAGITLGQVGMLLGHFLCLGRTERAPDFPHQGSSSELFFPMNCWPFMYLL